jgi:hypothetical protein
VGNVECPLTVTSHGRIPVKNTFGSSVVVFCECEIIELFPVEFHVFSAVHMNLGLLQMKLLTNGDKHLLKN